MKKIIALYEDNMSSILDENKLTRDVIEFSRYIMIPIDDVNRLYSCVKPSKYMLFTRAYIRYQMCIVYYNEDDAWFEACELLDPVVVDTESLCDVFGLLNSIDKLSVVNSVINGGSFEYAMYNGYSIGLYAFDLILFEGDTQIYQESYIKNQTSTIPYDPYVVTKRFKKLYDVSIISDLYISNRLLGLQKRKKSHYWKYELPPDYSSELCGFPCLNSNNILFLTKHELSILSELKQVNAVVLIFYARMDRHAELCEGINTGEIATIEQAEELMEEIYLDQSVHLYAPKNPDASGAEFIEIIANANFIFGITSIMTESLFLTREPVKEFTFDILIQFEITLRNDRLLTLMMNSCSLLSVTSVLEAIRQRLED